MRESESVRDGEDFFRVNSVQRAVEGNHALISSDKAISPPNQPLNVRQIKNPQRSLVLQKLPTSSTQTKRVTPHQHTHTVTQAHTEYLTEALLAKIRH